MTPPITHADIVFTRGTGFLSRAIRTCTRRLGEPRSKVNHVGIITGPGPLPCCTIVEALRTVVERPLLDGYPPGGDTEVAIYRMNNLTYWERFLIAGKAASYVGKPYGYGKILAHSLDWMLQGAYVFRRITAVGPYPICSWVVAHAYGRIGLDFGVPNSAASPDDIWDYVTGQPLLFSCVRPLSPIT